MVGLSSGVPCLARLGYGKGVPKGQLVSIAAFGARGDGRHNDRQAIYQALISAETVFFPSGRYHLGQMRSGEAAFDLRGLGRAVRIVTEPDVTLVVETVEPGMPSVFVLEGGRDIRIGDLAMEDLGGDNEMYRRPDAHEKWRGALGIRVVPGSGLGPTLQLGRLAGKRLTAVVCVQGPPPAIRIQGIRIRELRATDCYYGFNCQDNGDIVAIDQLIAEGCRRSYFVYGVEHHRVNVLSRASKGANADVLIKRYRFNTRDIDIVYHAEGHLYRGGNSLIVLEQQPPVGAPAGSIEGVRVQISVRSPHSIATPVLFRSYVPDGTSERAETDDNWNRIDLRFGVMETRAPFYIESSVVPRSPGTVHVSGAERWRIAPRVFSAFRVSLAKAAPFQ
jgi:hypothetical protein